jgi:hypothetical protein
VAPKLSCNPLLVAIVPALAVGIAFELFLGHRHDYTGHYAAGYGGTFAAAMFWLRTIPAHRFSRVAPRGVVPFCMTSVLLGGFAEATIFRIAKFDEIDFCNQSIGAVLASVCAMAYIRSEKPPQANLDYGMIAGIVFLGAGGCFAVA